MDCAAFLHVAYWDEVAVPKLAIAAAVNAASAAAPFWLGVRLGMEQA